MIDKAKTGKENTMKSGNNEQEFKHGLFATLQKTGIIDGIKSQLRVQLLNKLQGKLGASGASSISILWVAKML